METGDGDQALSLESQEPGNGCLDRVEIESACSYSQVGDDELDSGVLNQDPSLYGQPPDGDRYQTCSPADDSNDHYVAHDADWSHKYNERFENGNCVWAFANGGARAKDKAKQEFLDKLMKRLPSQIIGLAECDAETEQMLRAPGEEKQVKRDESEKCIDATLARPSFQYLTIRGSEPHSILLGVRKNFCRKLRLREFVVREEGHYQRSGNGPKRKLPAVTRALIADVETDNNVGFIGHTHTVMVVHLHFTVAKGASGKTQKKKEFFEWFVKKILEHNVKVVMGDFNMALWEITSYVRSWKPDMAIDLAAWYGWKSYDGIPSSDSCGIWILNTPGLYTLVRDVTCINADKDDDDDETSLLTHSKQRLIAPMKEDAGGWPRFATNGGPGQPLSCYQPATHHDTKLDKHNKKIRIPPLKQIRDSLTPSKQSADCISAHTPGTTTKTGIKEFFRCKQKPLHYEGFCSEKFGTQRGAHYPLCVMTQNNPCRPPHKHMERHLRNDKKARDLGLLRNWRAVTHNDNANYMARSITAVADTLERSRERAQRVYNKQGKHKSWDYVGSYGNHHNEGALSWNRSAWTEQYPGWDKWGKEEDGGSDYRRWQPKKVDARWASHSMSPKKPAFPPQAAECPVPGTIEGPMPTECPVPGTPMSSGGQTITWIEGGWRVDTHWNNGGQIGSSWATYPVFHPLPFFNGPEASDETVIQERMGSIHSC